MESDRPLSDHHTHSVQCLEFSCAAHWRCEEGVFWDGGNGKHLRQRMDFMQMVEERHSSIIYVIGKNVKNGGHAYDM